jgi:hypothetical protein
VHTAITRLDKKYGKRMKEKRVHQVKEVCKILSIEFSTGLFQY